MALLTTASPMAVLAALLLWPEAAVPAKATPNTTNSSPACNNGADGNAMGSVDGTAQPARLEKCDVDRQRSTPATPSLK
jgi:hypothetical protein